MATWPQWTFAAFLLLGVTVNLYSDGQKGSASGAVITIFVFALQVYVLYAGAFWSVWGFAP